MGIQNIEVLIGDTPSCVINTFHPSGTPAEWREKSNSLMTVCTWHRDQFNALYYLSYSWEPIDKQDELSYEEALVEKLKAAFPNTTVYPYHPQEEA